MRSVLRVLLSLAFVLTAAQPMLSAPIVVSGCRDVDVRVAEFRALLGTRNTAQPSPDGRREIDWEEPGRDVNRTWRFDDVFHGLFVEGGQGQLIRVSNGRFADVNPRYANQFGTFSGRTAVALLGQTSMQLGFLLGSDFVEDPLGSVNGFGVVFSDVDVAGSATIEPLSADGSLGTFAAPPRCTESGLSFIGVVFTGGERVESVRITAGERAIGTGVDDISDGGESDLVVMDDFIYSEPLAFSTIVSAALAPWRDEDGGFSEKTGARGVVVLGLQEYQSFAWLSYTARIEQASGAPSEIHLHAADGELLLTLADHAPHFSYGGLPIETGLLRQIVAEPSRFFIDVHTGTQTSLRGETQRGVAAPTKVTLPIIGRTAGRPVSGYRTDLAIANLSANPAEVLLEFIAQRGGDGAPATSRINLAPREQRVMEDVPLDEVVLSSGIGAMQLFCSAPVDVSARVYNDQTENNRGTYGEWERGMIDEEAISAGVLTMLSVADSHGFGPSRTNIGWFNPSARTIDLSFQVWNSTGTIQATATAEVGPYEQRQLSIGGLFPALDLRNFYIRFQATHPLFVYASVVNQTSGDSTLIPAQNVATENTQLIFPRVIGGQVPTLPGVVDYVTDVAILNPGIEPARATLIFHPAGSAPIIRSVEIAAGEQRLLPQIITSEFGLVNASGGMEIQSDTPLNAAGRVSSRLGAIGHFEAPVQKEDTNRHQGVLSALSSDHPVHGESDFTTTIGWFNAGPAPATLTFKGELKSVTRVAAPFEQLELPAEELFGQTFSNSINYSVATEADVNTVVVYATVRDLRSADTILVGPVRPRLIGPGKLNVSGKWQGRVIYDQDPVSPEETCESEAIAPIFVQVGDQVTATFSARCLPNARIKATLSGNHLRGTITSHDSYTGILEGDVSATGMRLKSSKLSNGGSFYIGHTLELFR